MINYAGAASSGGVGIWVSEVVRNGGTFMVHTRDTPTAGEATGIISFATDAPNVTLTIIGDRGKKFLEPTVTVNGVPATRSVNNDAAALATGTFQWTVTIPTAETINIRSSSGASRRLAVMMESPAIVSNLVIVDNPTSGDYYPTTQTEVKAGDPFFISFDTDKDIVSVRVVGANAGQSQTITIPATSSVTGLQVTCGSTTTIASLKVVTINTETVQGAISTISADSSNMIICNDIHPTLTVTSVNYPATQLALKDAEQAIVNMTTSDLDTILYSTPLNEIAIQNVTLDEATKQVDRIAGTYNDSANNFRVSATRNANGASSTTNHVIVIANVAPTLNISEPSPMRSGGNDGTGLASYTVSITSNQSLLTIPTTSVPQGTMGAFSSSGGYNYSSMISVSDNDPKGTFQYGALLATGLSGIQITAFTGEIDYTFEGIHTRTVNVPPFGATATINASIANPQNLTVTWSFTGSALVYNAADVLAPNKFTVTNIGATTFTIKLLDSPNVAASSRQSTITVGY